jgi:hypothetical protein
LCQAAEGHVVTKITRSRIRKRLKGKKKSAEHTAKNRASHLGVKLTKEHRINIGLALLGHIHTKQHNRHVSEARIGKFGGENSPRWLGGISKLPYPFIWTVELRNSIWKRDGYKCQSPFCKGKKCRLQTHHIDYDKMNCSPENLITLCIVCHTKTNSNREYWKGIFQHGIH